MMQYVLHLACSSVPNLAKYTSAPAMPVCGTHAFSCRHNPGGAQRHHFINDLIWRSLTRAGIPFVKELLRLTRSDGKRPWREGHSAPCDVIVTNTDAASYVAITSDRAAAEAAAQHKEIKYAENSANSPVLPVSIRDNWPINVV